MHLNKMRVKRKFVEMRERTGIYLRANGSTSNTSLFLLPRSLSHTVFPHIFLHLPASVFIHGRATTSRCRQTEENLFLTEVNKRRSCLNATERGTSGTKKHDQRVRMETSERLVRRKNAFGGVEGGLDCSEH